MSQHAPNSPSGFYQKELCAGSGNAQKGLPNTSNDEAIQGSAAHVMFDMGGGKKSTVYDQTELVVPSEESPGGVYTLDEDDTNAVREALDYVYSRPGAFHIESEQKVNPADFVLRDDMYGTLDKVVHSNFLGDPMIETIDYKHGFVLVEVEENSQVILYTLGLLAKIIEEAETTGNGDNFDPNDYQYKMTIVQPRADHAEGPIRSVMYTYRELLTFAEKYQEVAKAADSSDAKRTPGARQCRYCLARLNCNEFRSYVASVSIGSEIVVPSPGELEQALLRQANALTPDEIRVILDNAPLLRSFLKHVEKYAFTAYLKGQRGFGYKLVAGRNKKGWRKSEEDTKAALLGLTKGVLDGNGIDIVAPITVADVHKPGKFLTPTQMLARLKPMIDEPTLEQVKGLISTGREAPKLVPETNAAEALKVAVEDFFEPVEAPKTDPWL